jgi:hypothetical protein
MSRYVSGAKYYSEFGYSADIYGNFAAVGAPSDTAKGVQGGAVYIFEKVNGLWTQTAKVSPPSPVQYEGFGKAVSISENYLVVGSPDKTIGGLNKRGAIYVFKRTGHIWNYVIGLLAPGGLAYDNFGSSVCIYGNVIAAGAPGRDHSGKTNAGSAYLFGLLNNSWVQKATVNASDPFTDAEFGTSLDIFQSKLVVGAPAAEVLGFTTNNGGAAYVFYNTDANGYTWPFVQKLTPLGYSHNKMKFGYSVAMEGDDLVVGAPNYSGQGGWDGYLGLGGIVRFAFENNTWKFKYIHPEYNEQHYTGTSVALSNGTPVVGMPGSNAENGKVLLYKLPSRFVYDEDSKGTHKFGSVVAAHNGQFLVTAPKSDVTGRVFFGMIDE